MQSASEFQLSSDQLFTKEKRLPAPNGVLDKRLGVSENGDKCETCNSRQVDCAGHFGYIRLELPCFHIGYFKHTLTILQCICKTCACVLLDEESKISFVRKLRNPRYNAHMKDATFKKVQSCTLACDSHAQSYRADRPSATATSLPQIVTKCKKSNRCPNPDCAALNGIVKKVPGAASLKLVHEKYKGKNGEDTYREFQVGCMSEAGQTDLSRRLSLPVMPRRYCVGTALW